MGKVVLDITMSLDGFIAGPNDGPDVPLGEGGERLHEWVYGLAAWREPHGLEGGETNASTEVMEGSLLAGAVVVGKRMFDNAGGWGDNPPFHKPVFVLTHEPRQAETKEGGTTFTFVNDGVESALDQAQAAAGDKGVHIGGGADTAQQYLRAGLLDEIQIHVAPILLGGGRRLFDELEGAGVELEKTRVIETPDVTHMRFRVLR